MAGSGNDQAFFNAGTFKTLLLNPVTMQMRLIPTPWDLFCAGHIELPDGNILIAGGTARYENLDPVYAAGSMTVMNYDTNVTAGRKKKRKSAASRNRPETASRTDKPLHTNCIEAPVQLEKCPVHANPR